MHRRVWDQYLLRLICKHAVSGSLCGNCIAKRQGLMNRLIRFAAIWQCGSFNCSQPKNGRLGRAIKTIRICRENLHHSHLLTFWQSYIECTGRCFGDLAVDRFDSDTVRTVFNVRLELPFMFFYNLATLYCSF